MPQLDYHVIILIIAALYWAGVGVYRFFQWIARSVASAGATATPMRQAMAEAQQAQQIQQMQAVQQMARPQSAPLRVPPPSMAPWEMPRQPGAGGPAVPWETTSQEFARQERELLTEEPAALSVPLQSAILPDAPAPLRLFEKNDDLLRAIILQEALGPPLSRRPH